MMVKKRNNILIKIFLLLMTIMILTTFCVGCNEAERVSHNVSKEADNFNVYRRVTVLNCIKGETLFTVEGWISIHENENGTQLSILAEIGEGKYKKHIIGLSDNVAYSVEDVNGSKVSKYAYEVNYNPKLWMPITFKNID